MMNVFLNSQWKTEIIGVFWLVLLTMTMAPVSLHGAEAIQDGTLITGENLDEHLTKTFHGKTLDSLLTNAQKLAIREHGLRMKLGSMDYGKVNWRPRWKRATREFSQKTSYNPETMLVDNYVAGVPFPNLSKDDPHAGPKTVWNYLYGHLNGDYQDIFPIEQIQIDGQGGFERTFQTVIQRYYLKGRLDKAWGDFDTDGIPNTWYSKKLQFLTYPQDVRGVGNFAIRYTSGRLDDRWVYVRSLRRTRRVTGSTWMDPVPGGGDLLNDDLGGFGNHPTWLKSMELIDIKTVLLPWGSPPGDQWIRTDASSLSKERYPVLDTDQHPYYWPNPEYIKFTPVKTYVLKADLPKRHPYDHKVVYFNPHVWQAVMTEMYDKRGDLWRIFLFPKVPQRLASQEEGKVGSGPGLFYIDLKNKHGTVLVLPSPSQGQKKNTPGVNPTDLTLRALKQARPVGR